METILIVSSATFLLLLGFLTGYFYWKRVFDKDSMVVEVNAAEINSIGDLPILVTRGRGSLIVRANVLDLKTSKSFEGTI